MFESSTLYFLAWAGTIAVYIYSAIYAVGRLEGELNGIGKRLDMVISQLQTLERRFAELERYTREKKKKGDKENGGDQDFGSTKSNVY